MSQKDTPFNSIKDYLQIIEKDRQSGNKLTFNSIKDYLNPFKSAGGQGKGVTFNSIKDYLKSTVFRMGNVVIIFQFH